MDKDNRKNNLILEIKTTQTGAFKETISMIKNVIPQCCIEFVRPKENTKGGMRILGNSPDNSTSVKLVLDAMKFEYFECIEPSISIGIDMFDFHKKLSIINNDDPIILYMDQMHILCIDNIKKKMK